MVQYSYYKYISGPFRSFYQLNTLNNVYILLISIIFESNTKKRHAIVAKHHSIEQCDAGAPM